MTFGRLALAVALMCMMMVGLPWGGPADVWAGVTPSCVNPGPTPEESDCDNDGFTPFQGDCDDFDATRHPGAADIPDGIDNNCNGLVDEVLGLSLFATDEPVIVDLQFAGAGFESDIYLFTPGGNNIGFIGTNRDFKTVNLGTFPVGTELIFGLVVHNTFDNADDVFYMGPACRNFDNFIHAAVADLGGGQFRVGFEDLRSGQDDNYADAVFTVSGVTSSPIGGCGGLGHFMCYSIKATRGNVCAADRLDAGRVCQQEEDCVGGETDVTDFCVPNKLTGQPAPVSLLDDVENKSFQVKKPAAICNPASKAFGGSIELATDTVTHLESFSISQAKGEAKFVKQNRTVNNQFGSITLEVQKAERLMVPSAKQHGGTEPPAALDPGAHFVDHFKCYKAKAVGTFAPITIGSVDQFGQSKAFTLKKPTRICLAADKNSEGFKEPTARLVCYQALVVKGEPKHAKVTGLFVNNQFGPDEVDTLKETEFCVPSSENPPA